MTVAGSGPVIDAGLVKEAAAFGLDAAFGAGVLRLTDGAALLAATRTGVLRDAGTADLTVARRVDVVLAVAGAFFYCSLGLACSHSVLLLVFL